MGVKAVPVLSFYPLGSNVRGGLMTEEFGWNVFGVAVAVLGIVIAYAFHQRKKAPEPPKE